MKRCYQTKKNLGIKRSILFQSLIILYVLFLIVSQMTSPTTAYFNDTEVIGGNISIANKFEEENVLDSDESEESEESDENQENQENQEIEQNEVNQIEVEDEEVTKESNDTDTTLSTEVIDNQKMAEPLEVVHPPLEPEMSNPTTQLDEENVEKESDVAGKE